MIEYEEEIPGVLSVWLYDAPSCRAIIARAVESSAWAAARVSARAGAEAFAPADRPQTRSAYVLSAHSQPETARDFDRRMEEVIKPLASSAWRVELKEHSGTHLVRYSPGNYYRPHTDTGANLLGRYFTVLCYLNDDFEGGATSFPLLRYAVRPRAGKAVIFPSTYTHSAEPVKRGEKYVIVSWLTGPPPVRWTSRPAGFGGP